MFVLNDLEISTLVYYNVYSKEQEACSLYK